MNLRAFLKANYAPTATILGGKLKVTRQTINNYHKKRPVFLQAIVDGFKWMRINEDIRESYCKTFTPVSIVSGVKRYELKKLFSDNYYSGSIKEFSRIIGVSDTKTLVSWIDEKPEILQAVLNGFKWQMLTRKQEMDVFYMVRHKPSLNMYKVFYQENEQVALVCDENHFKARFAGIKAWNELITPDLTYFKVRIAPEYNHLVADFKFVATCNAELPNGKKAFTGDGFCLEKID